MDIQVDIIKAVQSISNSFFDFIFNAFSFLGEQYILIVIIALIYFVINKEKGEFIAMILFSSTLVNSLLKGIFFAPRPFQVDSDIINKRPSSATGTSFPSGHSQISSSFYGSIYLYFPIKKLLFLFVPVVLLIGFSRMYLGAHFLTDVVAGISMGLFVAISLNYLYARFKPYRFQIHIIIALIFLPFIFFSEKYNLFIKMGTDFYKGYALLLGFIFSIYIERKYVNFTHNVDLKTKIYRFIGSLLTAAIVYGGLKLVFINTDILIITFIRYFLLTFITLGIYPLLFLKINFLKEKAAL